MHTLHHTARVFLLVPVALALRPMLATAFVVNSTGDEDDATLNCTCAVSGTGACTLRAAIQEANFCGVVGGPPVPINFAIGTGVRTIQPLLELPAIGKPVTIDGTTQPPGVSCDFANGGTPLIEIDGEFAGVATGLSFSPGSDGSTVKGLVINRFKSNGLCPPDEPIGGLAITLQSDDNHIECNLIGTDVTGSLNGYGNDSLGIFMRDTGNNRVGGAAPGKRNIISGNGQTCPFSEIEIHGSNGQCSGGGNVGQPCSVVGDCPDTSLVTSCEGPRSCSGGGNAGESCNAVCDCPDSGPGTSCDGHCQGGANAFEPCNVVGDCPDSSVGNFCTGIVGNTIEGNYIGTDVTGTQPIGNAATAGDGCLIARSSKNMVRGNVISNNVIGVQISDTSANDNAVVGNLIGTDVTGVVALPNQFQGVGIDRGNRNIIGGPTALDRNVISGNGGGGVRIRGDANHVVGNYIGAKKTGVGALGNGGIGVDLAAATNTVVGGTTSPSACTGACNLIAANGGHGLAISGAPNSGATGNVVTGNFIGLDVASNDVGNTLSGVFVGNRARCNRIGGTTAAERNVIAANHQRGVVVTGLTSKSNTVEGNLIGITADGTACLGNLQDGVLLGAIYRVQRRCRGVHHQRRQQRAGQHHRRQRRARDRSRRRRREPERQRRR